MLSPGKIIDERFVIEEQRGSGGMGEVYRARDVVNGGPVAIKVLSATSEQALGRFAREARLLAQLDHQGIVSYIANGQTDNNRPYLAMDWLDGHDLAGRLKLGRMTVEESLAVLQTAAEALAYAHQRGVVHRDIKPTNIFLENGQPEKVRLIDFGIGMPTRRDSRESRITLTGSLLGTPGYMSPEQVRSSDNVGPATDVFALGCVFFECLTGRRAFPGSGHVAIFTKILFEDPAPLRDILDSAPLGLELLVERLLTKDVAHRPGDGAAVLAEIAALEHRSKHSSDERKSLSGGEMRIISIVMATDPRQQAPASEAETLPNASLRSRDNELAMTMRQLGGYMERLSDGSLVTQMRSPGVATDAAAQAARIALSIQSRLPGMAVALATGRSRADGRLPVGEVIDRAAGLLRRACEPRSATLGATIRLDELTAGLLDTRFAITGDDIGLTLSSEREPLQVQRTLLGTRTPFVGRARELGNLLATLEEVVEESSARAVLLTGAAGIGKSRLCAELLQRAPSRDHLRVFVARGEMIGARSSYGLLAQGSRRWFGIREGEPLAVRRQKLRVHLARFIAGEELERVATFIGEMIGTRYRDETSVQLAAAMRDARVMSDQIRLAWLDWMAYQCAEAPVLILLEDLHWGDVSTVKLLDVTLRHLADRPLMILALARPEVHDRFPTLWAKRALQNLRLSALPARAGRLLARSVLSPGAPVDTDHGADAQIQALVARAGGNAFFLEELIRAAAAGSVDAPETVLAMVQARLDSLTAEARRFLRAASIFGERFWLNGVLELLGVETDPLSPFQSSPTVTADDAASQGNSRWVQHLDRLIDAELIRDGTVSSFTGEEYYSFDHALVREAVYSTLTETDRALGHRLAGRWLERHGQSNAMVLAEHFERGGDSKRALGWYVQATKQALESDSLDEVHELAERGRACGAGGAQLDELALAQAAALNWQGALEDALPHALDAMGSLSSWPKTADGHPPDRSSPVDDLARAHSAASPGPEIERWYSAVSEAAFASWQLGERQTLLRVADALLGLTHPPVSETYVLALAHVGKGLLDLGDSERLRRLRKAIFWARKNAIQCFRGRTSTFLQMDGDSDLAGNIAARIRDVEAFQLAGDHRRACGSSINLGYVWTLLGVYSQAEPLLRAALAEAERICLSTLIGHATQNLGWCLAHTGKLEEAIAIEQRAVDEHRDQGNIRYEAVSRLYLAYAHARATSWTEAEHQARTALGLVESARGLRCDALAMLAHVLLGQGRSREALEMSHQTQDLLDDLENNIWSKESLPRLIHARALHATGHHEAARAAIARARTRLLERADAIGKPEWREHFLRDVRENARILALAEDWRDG